MPEKYISPLSETKPAEWLREGEELYLPEINKEGSLTTRRVSKDDKKAPQTLSRMRHGNGGEEGLTWDEWDMIVTGGSSSITSRDIGILTPDKFRLSGEEEDTKFEDSWDEDSAENEYLSEFDQNISLLDNPMSGRNLDAEAEVAKCGRKLVGQESNIQTTSPKESIIKSLG
jgi:hypothetical protein